MPFDGTEFSHALRPHVPPLASSSTRTPLVAWLQRLFLGDAGYAKLLYPGQPGRTSEMPAARLLIAARTLIENEQAWVQGAYYTPDRKRCAVGARRRRPTGTGRAPRWRRTPSCSPWPARAASTRSRP